MVRMFCAGIMEAQGAEPHAKAVYGYNTLYDNCGGVYSCRFQI